MTEYERHELSYAFPALTRDSGLNVLVDSIQAHGYLEDKPIVLFEDRILDGWNRYQASKIVGVEPTYREFEGTPEHARLFILTENAARRQMTKAQHAYAFVGMQSWLPENLQQTPKQISAATGASLGTVTKAFKAWDQSPERAQQVGGRSTGQRRPSGRCGNSGG